jgi:hypothetical protein
MKFDGTKLNPRLGVYQMPDGRLAQVGKPTRLRAARREWGWRSIVSVTFFSEDGAQIVGCETMSPAQFNKMPKSPVPMVIGTL